MRTKLKIITGFSFMILLLVTLAVLGHRNALNSGSNFQRYETLATFSATANQLENDIQNIAAHLYLYVNTADEATAAMAIQAADNAIKRIEISQNLATFESVKKNLAELKTASAMYRPTLERLTKNIKVSHTVYNQDVRNDVGNLKTLMRTSGEKSARENHTEGSLAITNMWHDVGMFIVSLSQYAKTRNAGEAEQSKLHLANIEKSLARLENCRPSEGAVLRKAVSGQFQSFQQLERVNMEVEKDISTLLTSFTADLARAREVSQTIGQALKDHGTTARADNDFAMAQTLSISAGGVVIGVAIALFIVIGLVTIMNRLGAFASAIAEGNFSHDPNIAEKGEIGGMVEAMKRIPSTLSGVLEEYGSLGNRVENGELLSKGNEDNFKGGFATLIRGTNGLLERFLTILENIPSPVVILNDKLEATYINAVARKVAGNNYKGKTCYQLFQRDDFGTEADALKRAVEQRVPARGETIAHPQAGSMDIAYNVIPMLNKEGEITSVMQLITDLTELKEKQTTILRVAGQATEVSDRVAATSEEIASQVEQISRGAEIQRSRLELTAGAMTEMNSTVLEVAKNAGQASEQSENMRQKAEHSALIVEKVVMAITEINTAAHTLQENMRELGRQAESIGSVMRVISDIADQTNLLALNAAIEAARAGDAGRGFAVVADEVRKLAEKTMSATQEVGDSITSIQNSAKTNIEQVDSAVKNVAAATELANSSGEALQEIVSLASFSSSVVASIATAAEEQSAASDEINRALEEINLVVGETTDGIVQSSEAVQGLSRMAQELHTTMDALK